MGECRYLWGMMKKRYHIISLSVLFVIGFLFVHSELDMFTPDQHAHDTHDFCDIVECAKPENPCVDDFNAHSLFVPMVVLSFQVNLPSEFFTTQLYNSHKPITDVDINILHSTFLI